jgi:hypothetical protein
MEAAQAADTRVNGSYRTHCRLDDPGRRSLPHDAVMLFRQEYARSFLSARCNSSSRVTRDPRGLHRGGHPHLSLSTLSAAQPAPLPPVSARLEALARDIVVLGPGEFLYGLRNRALAAAEPMR